jgi:hypothetical protein
MRLIELRGPDAADTHRHWQRRIKLWRRVLRAMRAALRPRDRQIPHGTELEFHAEACAPEGAQIAALYADGRLIARFDEGRRL